MKTVKLLVTVLRLKGVKLAMLLVLFAMLVTAGVYGHTKTAVVITILMVLVGANGETLPLVPESNEELKFAEERDSLVGDHSTFNPAFKYYRAGNCKCPICGLEFRDHPVIRMPEKRFYGCELFVLCNTDRVKL